MHPKPKFPFFSKLNVSMVSMLNYLTSTALGCTRGLLVLPRRGRATWRYDGVPWMAAWPEYKPHLTHRKHFHEPHTWGVQKQSRLRCVDNSKIGREAMAEGKPPK